MKRRTLKWIVCTVIMTLTLSVTACGGSGDPVAAAPVEADDVTETEDEAEPEIEEEPEAESEIEEEPEAEIEAEVEPEEEAEAEEETGDATEAESDSDGEKTEEEIAEDEEEYVTLEDYYNDPTVYEALKSVFDAMAGDGMSANCEVKGNEFTVIIKIEDRSRIVDGMGAALDAALNAQEDTFKEQVKLFDEVIGQEGVCTVIMRYTDPDDNTLAEKAFTAN